MRAPAEAVAGHGEWPGRTGATGRELVTAPRLADALVAKGMITAAERDWALAMHARTGSTLTVTLIAPAWFRARTCSGGSC